jgi:hypothetical protein
MAGITERNKQKNELASIGFSMKYIDEWQPKTTLYRHKPSYSVSGKIDSEVGTAVTGVPGSPDYVLRKSKLGLFPWLPGGECTCKWCVERGQEKELVANAAETASKPVAPQGNGMRRMGPHFKAS